MWDDENSVWTVGIPDVILAQPKDVQCYIYLMSAGSGVTIYQLDIPIVQRARPSDAVFDPGNVIPGLGDLLEQLDEMAAAAEACEEAAAMSVRYDEAQSLTAAQKEQAQENMGLPPVPAAPTTDGTYTLKCTVSGGSAVYAWTEEAVT